MATDETLLQEIRDNFQYAVDYWREIREEARKDMRYIAGDPWEPKEKKQREDEGRLYLAFDELGQYVNQLINGFRENKRAISVIPIGSGATDKTAEIRGNRIRQIEYKSNAQAAYATGFENAAQRSYGYWRVNTRYVSDDSFDLEPVIRIIPNPDSVYLDPDYKEADSSDKEFTFVLDVMKRAKFKSRFPKAAITDFSTEFMRAAPAWIRQDDIQVGEYWKLENISEDVESPEATGKTRKRTVLKPKVTQYITNGVEILETHEWPGRWIPIVPVFGKELYIDDGSGSKRMLMSLVRLARDPYKFYCYLRTTEAELVAMTPKTPYFMYEGQQEGHEDELQTLNTSPRAYQLVKGITSATGATVLPLPQRPTYEPQIQPLEIGAEAARRAIQAAMGISALPTPAQRQNQKSGVALERIETQQNQGSFHFIDNMNRALEFTGRILDDLLDKVEDTPRHVSLRMPDESHKLVHINGPDPNADPAQQQEILSYGKGEHDVTISTGPSYQSQRDQAQEFAESMGSNPQLVQAALGGNATAAKLLSLAIKLRNFGPLGDEMADTISPPTEGGDIPAQAMAAIQQGKQQLDSLHAYAQQLEGKLQQMQQEKDAKVLDNQMRLEVARLQEETKILIAEIETKAQDAKLRLEMEHEVWKELHGAAHEAATQSVDHSHETDQAAQAQQGILDQVQQTPQGQPPAQGVPAEQTT